MKPEEKAIKRMRDYELDIFIATFYKETQVGRSISSSIRKDRKKINTRNFKNDLRQSINKLRNLVDKGTIKNIDIRNEIKKLSEYTGVSIGQSQKVINVYLKVYCLILNKPIKILKELDCPLDSITMGGKDKIKNVNTIEQYEEYQKEFEENYGIRILKDVDYDEERLREFSQIKD